MWYVYILAVCLIKTSICERDHISTIFYSQAGFYAQVVSRSPFLKLTDAYITSMLNRATSRDSSFGITVQPIFLSILSYHWLGCCHHQYPPMMNVLTLERIEG